MIKKGLFLMTAIIAVVFLSVGNTNAADTVVHKMMWENYGMFPKDSGKKDKMFDHPMIELYSGMNKVSIHENYVETPFEENGMIEIRLGSMSKRRMADNPGVIKFNDNFLFVSHYSDGYLVEPTEDTTDLKLELLHFGLGSSSGYGYKFGENSDLIFCHSSGLTWSKVTFDRPQDLIQTDSIGNHHLDVYGSKIRFGGMFEGAIRIQPIKNLAIKIGYQRDLIYPRHLFWKWMGSELIEGIGQGLVDGFIDHVFKASPVAGPIVYFVLKNGISYAAYELRKEKMNWPFKTSAPLFIETYKLGLSFSF